MAAMAGKFSDHLAELEGIVRSHGYGRANETSLAAAEQLLLKLRASEEARDIYLMAALALIATRLPILYSERRHQGHEGGAGGVRNRTLADCHKVRSRLLHLERERSGQKAS